MALGFEQVLRALRWRPLRWAVSAVVVALLLVRIDAYHRFGRPHWDRLADAVREVQRPGERVLTIDHWAMKCLSYYLNSPVATIADKPHRLRTNLETSRSLLLVSRAPLRPEILEPAGATAELVRIPRTADLSRFRRYSAARTPKLSSDPDARPRSWRKPVAERIPDHLERDPPGCLARLFRRWNSPRIEVVTRLDFNPGDRVYPVSGWSRPRQHDDGTTWAWVRGSEASVDLGLLESIAHTIAIRLAPSTDLAGTQWIRVVLNGHVLGEKRLNRGSQVVHFNAPARFWRDGRALLVLQFSRIGSGAAGSTPLSAAVDWIEWTPRSRPAVGQSG